jgi:hypothetical protein
MSLKDIFDKQQTFSAITPNTNIEELGKEVESIDYIKSYINLSNKNLSNVDWENPEEFAKYGSAEKYYEDAITNIYKTYPYDGSLKEKNEWIIDSSELSNYIFENRYPRNNGYINLGYEYGNELSVDSGYSLTDRQEYISFNGTLNVSEDAKNSQQHFELSNKFSKEQNLKYNLDVNGESGCTVEFYFKKNDNSGSNKQVVFDLWNGQSYSTSEYGRFRIEIHPGIVGEDDKFYIELMSGSSGFLLEEVGSDLAFDSWKHYAISLKNEASEIKVELYVNGDRVQQFVTGSSIGQIAKAVTGQLGSLITQVPGTYTAKGYGKLSGSLDEFRFWKTRRTDKEIARNYFLPVGAGTNTDTSNTDLGVYFKFNEGVYSSNSISSYDKIILDYSGRMSNGTWAGYSVGSRNTESAIVLSENAESEFKDPVVYSTHADVLEILEYYTSLGREYDIRNTNSMYSTLPDWIVQQDNETGEKVKDLMQIMSEFFDELNLKIAAIPTIKNMDYEEAEQLSFVRKVLQNVGFKNLNLLENSTLLEEFLTRTEDSQYEEKLYKIKRQIYKNIYNNIINIYKSKGTNKSFRNLLHCFGIDESIVKLKMYSDNIEYTFDDKYRNHTEKQKLINFNDPNLYKSTIFQAQETGNSDSLGYLPGDIILSNYGNTFETSFIFPKKFDKSSVHYVSAPFVDSSLFGIHESNNGTWESTDDASIQVFFRKSHENSKDGYFILSSSCFGTELSSSLIKDVYNNEKWNISLTLRKEKDLSIEVSGSDVTDYILDLYGVSTTQDIKQKNFKLSATIAQAQAEQYFQADKIIYAGAHRTNFSGSVLMYTDVKLNYVRFWNNYIENDVIDIHAKDLSSFGPQETYRDIRNEVKNIDTLCLFWDFQTVTGSDSGSEFIISDVSSGSLGLFEQNEISQYTKYQFTGKGFDFKQNDDSFLSLDYIPTVKRNLPEDINSDDLVNILSEDDEVYTRDTIPVNHYFSVEKSMYSIISQEMINWLGTVRDFNDLLGKPKYRYEKEYSDLEKLRHLFFMNAENEPDFESFLNFYKWIDEAILNAVLQVVPASLNVVDNVFNIYESHILERNKYQHKLPTIEFKGKIPEANLQNLINPNNSWKNGCFSRYNRAVQNILKRTQISPIINDEINRQSYLVYNVNIKQMPIFQEKKRETEIIRTAVGFDLEGISALDIDDIFELLKDC